MPRLNAEVDEVTRRALYHALLDDDLSFSDWIRRQIDAYIAERRIKPTHPHARRRKPCASH
jgi:hypothetical protein